MPVSIDELFLVAGTVQSGITSERSSKSKRIMILLYKTPPSFILAFLIFLMIFISCSQ
jgi:hypothetical protein